MFDNIVTAVGSLLRSALAVLAGTTAADGQWDIPPAQGSIIEIEPGVGPSWGTLSGLTAHPTDPTRLYAVTDQNSPPIRIVEIELEARTAKVVRQIAITVLEGDLDPEGIVAAQDGRFWLASEGGTRNVPPNRLLDVGSDGCVVRAISLPR
jgi:hypothetical protein